MQADRGLSCSRESGRERGATCRRTENSPAAGKGRERGGRGKGIFAGGQWTGGSLAAWNLGERERGATCRSQGKEKGKGKQERGATLLQQGSEGRRGRERGATFAGGQGAAATWN